MQVVPENSQGYIPLRSVVFFLGRAKKGGIFSGTRREGRVNQYVRISFVFDLIELVVSATWSWVSLKQRAFAQTDKQ